MKYIEVYITVESSEVNGYTAIGRIVAMLKKLPDGAHVLLKTKSTYVYDIIKDGRPWKWEQDNWVTEVRRAEIHGKGTWKAFIDNHGRFASFEIEMF